MSATPEPRNGSSSREPKIRRGRWSQAETEKLRKLYGLRDLGAIARDLGRPLASVRAMVDKLFAERANCGPWSEDEVAKLKRYIGASPSDVIAKVLGRQAEDVDQQIERLSEVRKDGSWTRAETQRLRRIYGTRTDEDLARIFGRDVQSIKSLAETFALAKDKAFLRKLHGDCATRMPRWSSEELDLLRELYSETPNLDIARKLNRSVKSIVSKAHHLGLKKNRARLREMGRENVSLRYRNK